VGGEEYRSPIPPIPHFPRDTQIGTCFHSCLRAPSGPDGLSGDGPPPRPRHRIQHQNRFYVRYRKTPAGVEAGGRSRRLHIRRKTGERECVKFRMRSRWSIIVKKHARPKNSGLRRRFKVCCLRGAVDVEDSCQSLETAPDRTTRASSDAADIVRRSRRWTIAKDSTDAAFRRRRIPSKPLDGTRNCVSSRWTPPVVVLRESCATADGVVRRGVDCNQFGMCLSGEGDPESSQA